MSLLTFIRNEHKKHCINAFYEGKVYGFLHKIIQITFRPASFQHHFFFKKKIRLKIFKTHFRCLFRSIFLTKYAFQSKNLLQIQHGYFAMHINILEGLSSLKIPFIPQKHISYSSLWLTDNGVFSSQKREQLPGHFSAFNPLN